jgi:hypothetical protein
VLIARQLSALIADDDSRGIGEPRSGGPRFEAALRMLK